jgi:hypothetical protein
VQFRTMIAFGLPGLHDRRAVRDWMEGQTADVEAIYNSLPSLDVGEAWIWTPDRNELRRERFRRTRRSRRRRHRRRVRRRYAVVRSRGANSRTCSRPSMPWSGASDCAPRSACKAGHS